MFGITKNENLILQLNEPYDISNFIIISKENESYYDFLERYKDLKIRELNEKLNEFNQKINMFYSNNSFKENVLNHYNCSFKKFCTSYGIFKSPSNFKDEKNILKNFYEDIIKYSYCCDQLLGVRVRQSIARHGYGLDILINDEYESVRKEVAKAGYGLDKLINDDSYLVRIEVVDQNYNLKKFINDPSIEVRKKLAWKNFGLDILVNDENWEVRSIVARVGYGLDKLINDKHSIVRQISNNFLERHNLSLDKWREKYPNNSAL